MQPIQKSQETIPLKGNHCWNSVVVHRVNCFGTVYPCLNLVQCTLYSTVNAALLILYSVISVVPLGQYVPIHVLYMRYNAGAYLPIVLFLHICYYLITVKYGVFFNCGTSVYLH